MVTVEGERRELSPMQLGLLYRALTAEGWTHAGPGVCELSERLDPAAFARAWRRAVAEHPLLRARFDWSDPERPVQVVEPEVDVAVERHAWPDAGPDRLRELLAQHVARPFDLARAPLFRVVTASAGGRDWCFVVAGGELLDRWSVESLLAEVLEACASAGGAGRRPSARPTYGRYVEQVGDPDLAVAERFWREQLAVPAADLVPAAPREGAPGPHDAVPLELERDVIAALEQLATAHGCRLSTVLASAWALLLSRHARSERVVLGVRTSARRTGAEHVLGPFENAIPIVAEVDEDATAACHLAAWRARELACVQHAHAPAPLIQAWSADPALPVATTEVDVADLDAPGPRLAEHPLVAGRLLAVSRTAPPDSLVQVAWRLEDGRPRGVLRFRPDQVGPEVARRLAAHLVTLLSAIARMPDRPLRELPMLAHEEERRQRFAWNRTRTRVEATPVHRLVTERAREAPRAVALEWRGRRVRYRSLERAADRWAARLRSEGVGPEVLVGVHLRRSPRMVAVLLGVLKAGGAYLPLDPAHPGERVAYLLRDAGARLVVSSSLDGRSVSPPAGVRVLRPTLGRAGDAARGPAPLDGVLPDNLAYVLYTSGSTGVPKGVQITHRGVANLLHWARERFGADLGRVLATTSIGFDCAAVELLGTLTAGGTAVLAENVLDAADGPETGCRLLNAVPSAVAELVRAGRLPGSVRTVTMGGEPAPGELVEALHRMPGVERVLNLYGPTETTTYSTAWTTPRTGGGAPPIGRPLPNTQVYVCDGRGRLVPVGVPGELHIGGAGVARGYLGHPDMTAERFLPDHLGDVAGGRLYRTGDLARYREDGAIEFLGRVDQQVKVRGHRVEPEEVRVALARHPAVRTAVVRAWDGGSGGRLVAYVVPEPSAGVPGEAALREHLSRSLPDFMLPARIVVVDRLPLLPNGKVDWRSLPAPDRAGAPPDGEPDPPRTDGEAALAGIWRELLGLERVGPDDDFFELGGHSLLAMRVQSRIRTELGVELPLRLLFEERTIGRLALAVALARNSAIVPVGEHLERGEL